MRIYKVSRVCEFCKKEFSPTSPSQKFCSKDCKTIASYSDGNRCKICNKPAKNGKCTCGARDCILALGKSKWIVDKIKATKLKNFGDPNYNGIEKTKATNLIKYGSEFVLTSKHGKDKIRETSLERYGCEDPRSSDECQKHREATIKKTGVSGRFHTNEWNAAMTKKYGTTIPYQVESIKEKGLKTLQINFKDDNIKAPIQIPSIKRKIESTNMEKYGHRCSMMNEDVRKRVKRKYELDGISFDSKSELEFYKYAKSLGYIVEREPISIKYIDDLGIEHLYFPDFRINGKLYEVKADYFLNGDELVCPYKWANTEKHKVKLAAKSKCMRENSVILVKYSDIKKKIFPKL